jgi:hypothetical protein
VRPIDGDASFLGLWVAVAFEPPDPTTVITRGSTYDNRANLAPAFSAADRTQVRGPPVRPARAQRRDIGRRTRCPLVPLADRGDALARRRIDFTVVAAPPSMTLQWQDELEAKFGLAFTIIDRERVAELRRLRGFGVNPTADPCRSRELPSGIGLLAKKQHCRVAGCGKAKHDQIDHLVLLQILTAGKARRSHSAPILTTQ